MILLQVNLRQKNLVMMTQAILMREIRPMTMKTARKLKMEKMTPNNKQTIDTTIG